MSRTHATGTTLAFATTRARASEPLPLDTHVPCPGPRFGKAERYRATLLTMKGDASFVVDDPTLVYAEAKKLGFTITTRREGKKSRVWRVK